MTKRRKVSCKATVVLAVRKELLANTKQEVRRSQEPVLTEWKTSKIPTSDSNRTSDT